MPFVCLAYYVRILQFNNGRLAKKKKTSTSTRLVWGENETVSFDVDFEEPRHLMSFMLVLCCKLQNSTTPSSPESPQSPETSVNGTKRSNSNQSSASRKEKHIGHFVLDNELWLKEILRRPRKQVLTWHKLYWTALQKPSLSPSLSPFLPLEQNCSPFG